MIVSIDGIDDFGRGVSHDLDKVCFIYNAIIGEKVKIEIVRAKKKYYEARIIEYIIKSSKREKCNCLYEDVCGGCQIPFMCYEDELVFKKNKVKNIMEKFSSLSFSNIDIESGKRFNYRNKLTLVVNDGLMGLVREGSNDFVSIDKCLISNDVINDVILNIRNIVFSEKGINKIVIKCGNRTNEVLLSIYGNVLNPDIFISYCNVLVINDEVLTENKYISSYILDKKFYLSNSSFFQVNYEITNYLYSFIRDKVRDFDSRNVLDLYCGVGTIGICVSDLVDNVYGIEIVAEAIEMANLNKKLNNTHNIKFNAGDVGNLIYNLDRSYDTYILDPPRSGVSRNVINEILDKLPNNIIYVSCDPVTLARDINLLKEKYDVLELRLFNMFPRTYHVESIVVLEKR